VEDGQRPLVTQGSSWEQKLSPRVFTQEPSRRRVIVSGTVVVDAQAVKFAPGVSIAVGRRASDTHVAKRPVAVLHVRVSGCIRERHSAAQGISHVVICLGRRGAHETFIHSAREQVRRWICAGLLYGIDAAVEEVGRRGQDRLAHAPSQRIITKSVLPCIPSADKRKQLPAR